MSRIIKYSLSFLAVFFAFLVIGESLQLDFDSLENNFFYIDLIKPKTLTDTQMISELQDSAKRNNIDIIVIKRSSEGINNTNISIYGSESTEKYFNDQFGMKRGTHQSVFLGTSYMRFYDLKTLKNPDKISDYYLIGTEKNIYKFRDSIAEEYSATNVGKYQRIGNSAIPFSYVIWIIADAIIIIFTLYDIINRKKENTVRMIYGEKRAHLILNDMIYDICAFFVMSLLSILALSGFSEPMYQIKTDVLMLCVLVIADFIIHLLFEKTNVRLFLSGAKPSNSILVWNYTVKSVTAFLTILLMTENCAVIYKDLEYSKLSPFMNKHKDYYYVNMDFDYSVNMTGNEMQFFQNKADMTNEKLYINYFTEYDATLFGRWIDADGNGTPYAIIVNRNASSFYKKYFNEIKNTELGNYVYFLVPEDIEKKNEIYGTPEQEYKKLKDYYNYGETISGVKYNYKFITYKKARVPYADSADQYIYKWADNPIVVINNIDMNNTNFDGTEFTQDILVYDKTIMYKITPKQLEHFVKDNMSDGTYSLTNVYDDYCHKLKILNRGAFISFAVIILVLFMDVFLMYSVLKVEYETDSIEIAVKKINGYSVLQKNRKIILTSLISVISAVICSSLYSFHSNGSLLLFSLLSGIAILLSDMVMLFIFVKKIETRNIPLILKGEIR